MKLQKWLPLVFLCASAAPSFTLDRNSFSFSSYDLDVRVECDQQRIGVRGKVTLRNDSSRPQKNAVLQVSSSLDWRSIQVEGKPVQFVSQAYTSDIDHTGALSEAIVSLPREVASAGTVELEIGYEGTVSLDATRLTRIGVPEDRAPHSDWDQISSVFSGLRGVGYVVWYPIATEAANLSEGNSVFETVGAWKQRERGATMHVALHLGDGNSGIAATLVQNASECQNDSGNGTVNDCTYTRLDRTVPAFFIAPYSTSLGSLTSVLYLDDRKAEAQMFSDAAERVSPLVREWFGTPGRKVEVLELADGLAAPFESGDLLLTPLARADPKLAQILLIHQLTHATLDSPRPWIGEGLAHFAQALWREQESGRPAALDYLGLHRSALAEAEKTSALDQASSAAHSLISTGDEEMYRSKAMFVWWMLRDMLGAPGLKRAVASYRGGNDTQPSYLQRLLETQSHKDLEWFFDDWVYRDRGLPDFRVASVYPRQMLNSGYLVTITVENLGAAGAEVPVLVRTESGDVSQRLEVLGKSTATIRVEVPSFPSTVEVNDGSVPESDMTNNSFQVPKPAK